MKKTILNILTYNGHFGQLIDSSCSIDLEAFVQVLESTGEFKCHLMPYSDLALNKPYIDQLYLVGSHQNRVVKEYIDDLVTCLFAGEYQKCLVIGLDLVKAHDNKGYQVLLADKLGLTMPKQRYMTDLNIEQLLFDNQGTVLKRVKGAGSKGVIKVDFAKLHTGELNKFLNQSKFLLSDIYEHLFYLREKARKALGRSTTNRVDYYRPTNRLVAQELIEGASFDYKVLVYFEQVYVLKRNVRKGDFRASGSGLFEFVDKADEELLSFCLEFRKRLTTPYLSLDVIRTDNGYVAIEFQCLHFGPYTKVNAQSCYKMELGRWVQCENTLTLEEEMGQAIINYLTIEKAS